LRLIEGTPQGRQTGVAFSLVTFFLAKQKKVTSCRATPAMLTLFFRNCFDKLNTNGLIAGLPPANRAYRYAYAHPTV
jgi:hypothetical protein